jgi:5-methylcytosine-specific restriction endonuclease McrA
MWMQFDHVVPHSRGGDNSLENVIVTCAPCNFGRMERTLEEVGLIDPRTLSFLATPWDGLERLLPVSV